MIVACEREPELRTAVAETVSEPNAGGLAFLLKRILATGCIEATRMKAREMAAEAGRHLHVLEASEVRDALSAVVQSAIRRTH